MLIETPVNTAYENKFCLYFLLPIVNLDAEKFNFIYCGKQAITVNNQIHCHRGYNENPTKHLILFVHVFTDGNVNGGLSFYISECY